jgi:hypothetical protein
MAEPARHYTQRDLKLREDVDGARMWSIALDQTMLTYFEVDPNSRFEMHSHESEQITYVLEGELVFTAAGRTMRVGRGETIAIPSMYLIPFTPRMWAPRPSTHGHPSRTSTKGPPAWTIRAQAPNKVCDISAFPWDTERFH